MPSSTMMCAYCGSSRPWDRDNFPHPLYAECTTCVDKRRQAAEDALLSNRVKRFFSRLYRAVAGETEPQ